MSRPIVVFTLALAAASCGGGDPAATPRPAGDATAASAPRAAPRGFPIVRMQAGTDFTKGIATLACVDDRCDRNAEARPARYVRLGGRGLLTFVTGRRFRTARLEVHRNGAVVEEAPLRPGTTMAYVADLRAGRYVVSLTGRWQDGRGSWVFGLKVPRELV